ncbi:MAG: hypothetical protein WC323_00660 [Patescibacteria group bacterium]|jgi:hypothetical protein
MFDNLNQQQGQGGQPNQNLPQSPGARSKPAYSPSKISAAEPEDIFAGTDSQSASRPAAAVSNAGGGNIAQAAKAVSKPPQFQPKSETATGQNQSPAVPDFSIPNPNVGARQAQDPERSNGDKKYVIIGIIVITVLVVILISMIALAYYKASSTPEDISDLPIQGNTANEADTAGQQESFSSSNNINSSLNLSESEGGVDSVNSNFTTEGDATTDSQAQKNNQYILEEITDSDKDGMTDGEEKRLGTDPNSSDTDGDGLFDREEIRVYKTDPINPDSDGDGYSDGAEVKNGYNPNGQGKLYELP